MTNLLIPWLPILLSAVIVFIVSSFIHMVSPWHRSDYPKTPNEDKVMDVLRPLNIPPGDYVVPRPSGREEIRSPEFIEKMNKGPVMMFTVFPNGPSSMGMSLVLWFIYLVVIGFFIAYVAGLYIASQCRFPACLSVNRSHSISGILLRTLANVNLVSPGMDYNDQSDSGRTDLRTPDGSYVRMVVAAVTGMCD